MNQRRSRVLLGLDPDAGSPALEHAEALARALDGEVVLVHALDPGAVDAGASYARALSLFEEVARRCGAVGAPQVLRFEDPATLLLRTAAELQPVLVVLGGTGAFGPIARSLVRSCPRPLWFAGSNAVSWRIAETERREPGFVRRLRRGLEALPEDAFPPVPPGPGEEVRTLDLSGIPALARVELVRRHWRPAHNLLVFGVRSGVPLGGASLPLSSRR